MSLIVFDLIKPRWEKFRSATSVQITRVKRLRELTLQGEAISRDMHQRQRNEFHPRVQPTIETWAQAVLAEIHGEAFAEHYGFETMPFAGKLDKLREITARLGTKYRVKVSDVAG